jgi:hypothetical protein
MLATQIVLPERPFNWRCVSSSRFKRRCELSEFWQNKCVHLSGGLCVGCNHKSLAAAQLRQTFAAAVQQMVAQRIADGHVFQWVPNLLVSLLCGS